ncbi:MAG: glycosyltransferase [Bacteroidales bacterium]|nr:glycosyltransferase [Bacteroidales bacterium]
MDISVVVPVFNEDESLPELCAWIHRVMAAHQFTYEVILIDDGSSDNSWAVIEELHAEDASVKGIKFRRNYGKSAALNQGFQLCQGNVVITMDADMQDSPDEIPGLYEMIVSQGFDLVSGWKKVRHDPSLSKNIPSKFFNRTTSWMSGVKLHDHNCGLKAYRKEVIKSIEVYGEMHRFIPVIAKWAGFRKIGEKVVEHRPRKYGITKFGLERFVNGFLDLISIMFVSRFGKKPMHLFGLLGSILFFFGFVIAVYLTYTRFFMDGYRMTERPIFFFGLLAMILGTQLFLAGFLAEMVARNAPERNHYLVEKELI